MKRAFPVLLCTVLLCLTFAQFAHADEWNKTYTLTGKPDLRVETSDADIHVDTWDQNTIEARVTTDRLKIGEGGIKIEERQDANLVELHVRFPHEHFGININWRGRRVDIAIHMPREGNATLRTGDGALRLTGLKGAMDLTSGDGAIEIDAVDGRLRAHSGDGHIRAAGRFDELNLSAGDGRIEARTQPGSTIANPWDLHAGDGSITLQLPSDIAADMDLHTGDGHITLDMPLQVEGRFRNNDIHGKLNGGGKLITIQTGDGSIQIEKS